MGLNTQQDVTGWQGFVGFVSAPLLPKQMHYSGSAPSSLNAGRHVLGILLNEVSPAVPLWSWLNQGLTRPLPERVRAGLGLPIGLICPDSQ